MPFQPPKREMCMTCEKAVYQAERMEAGGNIYHKLCFKCVECKMKLTLANYKQEGGNLYCDKDFLRCVTSQNAQITC